MKLLEIAEYKGYRSQDRVEFTSEKEWRANLPANAVITTNQFDNGKALVAQASNKDMDGIAGRFDTSKQSGWIYSGYMK